MQKKKRNREKPQLHPVYSAEMQDTEGRILLIALFLVTVSGDSLRDRR
jgi:hypothetical protein